MPRVDLGQDWNRARTKIRAWVGPEIEQECWAKVRLGFKLELRIMIGAMVGLVQGIHVPSGTYMPGQSCQQAKINYKK